MRISELINERMSNQDAYILLYSISKVTLGEYKNGMLYDIEDFDMDDDNILEIILFNEYKELKKKRGFKLIESEEDSTEDKRRDEKVFINERFITRYKKLIIRNNFEFNDDGILYVKSSRLIGLEK